MKNNALYTKKTPFWCLFAEEGGFEPPVQLPVRQFSKLLVSATHPPFLRAVSEILFFKSGCKGTTIFRHVQIFLHFFLCISQKSSNFVR